MKVYGVSENDVYDVVWHVSRHRYDGNVLVKDSGNLSNGRGVRSRFTLTVADSHRGKPGAIGVPGVKGNGPLGMKCRSNAACWHAHWDVIEELLNRYPHARVDSGFRLRDVAVKYTAATFRDLALATAHLDVGTANSGPITMPQCCECDHTLYTDVPPEVDTELSAPAYRPGRGPTVASWMPGSYARACYQPPTSEPLSDEDTAAETGWAYTNGGQHEPHPDTSGYEHNHSDWGSHQPGTTYPWDAVPAARPWVKPGSAGVGDTLALIDQVTGDTSE